MSTHNLLKKEASTGRVTVFLLVARQTTAYTAQIWMAKGNEALVPTLKAVFLVIKVH